MKKIIKNLFCIFVFLVFASCDQKIESKDFSGNVVSVKVFSSLTCPHCADFHLEIYGKLNKEYILAGKVKFEHYSFPLDLAALNAEKILVCNPESEINFQLLGEIYKQQNKWAVGSDINMINENIKKIGRKSGLKDLQMNECLDNKDLEEEILNKRINAQKKYKISSTPTIYLNEKKYEGKRDYESFKKAIEKIL